MAPALVSIQPALMEGLPPLDTTATDWESLSLLYGLIVYLQPKVIVEAGTYHGHFGIVAARLLADCEVWTADPNSSLRIPEGSPVSLPPNLHFVQDDFGAMLAAHPELREQVDFAFIDSGPPCGDETGIRWRHWITCKPYMRLGGIMACHDTKDTAGWAPYGDLIVRESLPLDGGRGLALWAR